MNPLTINPEGWRDAPYVEQWLGVWAMREQEFMGLADVVRGMNLQVHLAGPGPEAAREAAASGRGVTSNEGVALIELRGRMQKQSASMGQSASTVAVRRQMRAAAADPEIGSILMVIDSPGGTVSGTQDLADDIASAAAIKPVIAYIEDIGASAAYWAASQATQILAGKTAAVGSIGTYGVVYDMSAAAAMEGVKVHVVRAGDMKGAGVPGTEVTAAQLADYQREVNSLNEFFLAGVAQGRKLSMDQVRSFADGRVWIGQQAVDMGLIDGVSTIDQALGSARAMASKRKGRTMAAATVQEIKAECSGVTDAFVVSALTAGLPIEQVRKDWMAQQALDLEAARKEAADARTKADAAVKAPGVDPLKTATDKTEAAGGSAVDEFTAAVDANVKAGLPRSKAVSAVVRENPALHAQYVQEHNANYRPGRES